MKDIKHVSVIGGGIMGAGIAALFANNGIHCTVYDLTLELARGSIGKLSDPKAKIPTIYTNRSISLIEAAAVSDLSGLSKTDWIIEVVPEVLDLKRKVFADIDRFRRLGSIVSTNTSGLSVNAIAAGCSDDLRRNFLGTHFFNPVRFLPLVELIPCSDTDPLVVTKVGALFGSFGKKVVVGKDTPNFIANRVGIFMMMKVLQLQEKFGLDVETIDMLTGPPVGNPKTATFRLADMVGIDTLVHAAKNCLENCTTDSRRELFRPPAFLERMVSEKMLGDKTGVGFYRKQKGTGKKSVEILDLNSFTYQPTRNPKSDAIRTAKTFASAEDKIRSVMTYHPEAIETRCICELVLDSAAYALSLVGEIADDIATIDNALKWGFAKEVGPIETLDILGLRRSVAFMERFQIAVPEILVRALAHTDRLYREVGGRKEFFCLREMVFKPLIDREREVRAVLFGTAVAPLAENLSASLWDMGDNVLYAQLQASMVPGMNPVDDHVLSMLDKARNFLAGGRFQALVVGGKGKNFSVGAQLAMVLELAKAKQWKVIEFISGMLQDINLSFRHAAYPVVVAPHGLTLGGGMEIALGGRRRVVHAEFYGGLVEVGVGLIPAGGGCTLLLKQFIDSMASKKPGPMVPVQAAFELIGFGKVSNSADNAIDLGLLDLSDVVVRNQDELLLSAKKVALGMVDGFQPLPKDPLWLPGEAGYLAMTNAIDGMVRSGKISDHSAEIARVQAFILTGGNRAKPSAAVSVDDMLALEREGFVKLCAMDATQERMAYMLKTGKPLIN